MNTSPFSLEEVISHATQLPLEQQRMLIDVLQHRYVDAQREQIAIEAQQSLQEFHDGRYSAQTAAEVIDELRTLLNEL